MTVPWLFRPAAFAVVWLRLTLAVLVTFGPSVWPMPVALAATYGDDAQFGSVGADSGARVVVDASGNVYSIGTFRGTVDFDPQPASTTNLTSAGSDDVFVVKLTATGTLVWARHFGSSSSDEVSGIAVDSSGNVYVTGSFSVPTDFDPSGAVSINISAGGTDVYVVKLNASGTFVWARTFGGASSDIGRAVTLDGSGNIYLTGDFNGTADFDPGIGQFPLTTVNSNSESFVVKLNSSGSFVWAGAMGNNGAGVGVDGSGNVYVVGSMLRTRDFDPGPGSFPLTSNGLVDTYVVKLTSSGGFVWARLLGGPANDGCAGLAVDASGNVYVTGDFEGTADFDITPTNFSLTSVGSVDAYIAKLDADGFLNWAYQVGSVGIEHGSGVAVTGLGDVYTIGAFRGDAYFYDQTSAVTLSSAGDSDVFLVKLRQAAPAFNVVPGAQSTPEDVPLVFSFANGRSVRVIDPDAGSIPLRVSVTVTNGTLTLNGTVGLTFSVGDGTADSSMTFTGSQTRIRAALDGMAFTPSANFSGSALLQITTVDLAGPTAPQTDTDSVAITITPVSDAPVATADAYTVVGGTTLTVPVPGVLGNDTDLESSPLTAVLQSDPAHGTLSLATNGRFTYTPDVGFSGTDSFTYRASDGTLTSNPVTVTITISPAPTRCSPRPKVLISTVWGGGKLQVTIQASPSGTGESNLLQAITFGTLRNAGVTVNGQAVASDQQIAIAPNAGSATFTVTRATAGQATTVPFTVLDGCGSWKSFVGGGVGGGF